MKTLNEYIIEGLLNKSNKKNYFKEKDINILNKKIYNSLIYNWNNVGDPQKCIINIYKNEPEDFKIINTGDKNIFTCLNHNINDHWPINFHYKKEVLNDIFKDVNIENWKIDEFKGIPSLSVKIDFNFWDNKNQIDFSEVSKYMPIKFSDISTLVFENNAYTSILMQNLNISSTGSIIFKFLSFRNGWNFENCNISTPKNVYIIEENSGQRKCGPRNISSFYCLGHFSNKITKYYDSFNPQCESLYFIFGSVYERDFVLYDMNYIKYYMKNNINTNENLDEKNYIIWRDGIQNANQYLLEAAVTYLLPLGIGYYNIKDYKQFRWRQHFDTIFMGKSCTIDEVLKYIPDVGDNYKAIQYFEDFIDKFKNIKNIKFAFKRKFQPKWYTLTYNYESKIISLNLNTKDIIYHNATGEIFI